MKKFKNDLTRFLVLLTVLAGSYFWYKAELHWMWFFVILIICTIVPTILIEALMPDKKVKKKRSAPKINNQNKNKKTSTKASDSIPKNRLLSNEKILQLPLEKLSPRELERLCYLYFQAKGYSPEETGEGADGGVDLVLFDKKHNAKVAVQIKHYIDSQNNITVERIRELDSARKNHGCPLAMFITTSRFTKDALLEADKRRIETHQLGWVQNNIDKWRFKK